MALGVLLFSLKPILGPPRPQPKTSTSLPILWVAQRDDRHGTCADSSCPVLVGLQFTGEGQ